MRKLLYTLLLIVLLFLILLNANAMLRWIAAYHAGAASIAAFVLVAVIFTVAVFVLLKTNLVMAVRSKAMFAVSVFTASLLLRTAFVLLVKTEQYSDFLLFHWVTAQIASGDPRYLSENYFSTWAYQTGFPAAMSVFYRLFGENILIVLVANCVFLSVSNVLIYLIARTFIEEKISRVAAVLHLFFPYVFGLSSVYTNQHLATMLFYAGIYVFLAGRGSKLILPFAAGALMALGHAIRPEGLVVAGAITGFLILGLPERRRTGSKRWLPFLKERLLPCAAGLISFAMCFTLVSGYFVISGLNPRGLSNNFPLYKFVVGLNHSTGGTYSTEDAKNLFTDLAHDPERRDREALKLIKQRLSVPPGKMLTLLKKKNEIMWTGGGGGIPAFAGMGNNHRIGIAGIGVPVGRFKTLFTFVNYLYLILLYTAGAITSVGYMKENSHPSMDFLTILFGLAFLIFLFIEVQHRYGYFVMPAIFMIAAPGLARLRGAFLGKTQKT